MEAQLGRSRLEPKIDIPTISALNSHRLALRVRELGSQWGNIIYIGNSGAKAEVWRAEIRFFS